MAVTLNVKGPLFDGIGIEVGGWKTIAEVKAVACLMLKLCSEDMEMLHEGCVMGGDAKVCETGLCEGDTVVLQETKQAEAVRILREAGHITFNCDTLKDDVLRCMHMSKEEKLQLTELFITAEPSVACRNTLITASHLGLTDVIAMLLDMGVPVNEANPSWIPPNRSLHAAILNKQRAVVRLLLQRGVTCTIPGPLPNAMECYYSCGEHIDIARELIAHGADVNAPVSWSCGETMTPLFVAAQRGCSRGVQLLLSHGADPNKGCIRHDGTNITPLQAAAGTSRHGVSTIKALLAAGADPSPPGGSSPLYLALRSARRLADDKVALIMQQMTACMPHEPY